MDETLCGFPVKGEEMPGERQLTPAARVPRREGGEAPPAEVGPTTTPGFPAQQNQPEAD